MKRKIILNIIVFIALLIPLVIFAADPPIKAPTTPVVTVLENIEKYLYHLLVFFIAPICIIIAAFYFVTAGGNEEQIKKARMFVLYALIGVVVAIAAKGMVNFLRDKIAAP